MKKIKLFKKNKEEKKDKKKKKKIKFRDVVSKILVYSMLFLMIGSVVVGILAIGF